VRRVEQEALAALQSTPTLAALSDRTGPSHAG
jgi:hypothetical protein